MLEVKGQLNALGVAQQIKASGGGSGIHTYSTTEQKVGKWIDDSDIYEITISLESPFSLFGTGTEFPAGVQTFLNGCAVVLGCIGICITSHQCAYINTEHKDSKWSADASADWTPDVLIFTYTKVTQP